MLQERGPVLSLFSWQNHPAFFITDGVIVIWSQITAPVNLTMAVSQTDIIIHNRILQEELKTVAITDSLTGLYNRGYFMDVFTSRIENTGFILIDLDHFKSVNDEYGHPEGDNVLQKTGKLLKRILRSADIPGRCGGEEFGVLVPKEDLVNVAEKIRGSIESELKPPAVQRQITCSIGISQYPNDGLTVDELYQAADQRLYRAKETGRNRVEG